MTAAADYDFPFLSLCNLNCIKAFEKEEQERKEKERHTAATTLMLKVTTPSRARWHDMGAAPNIMGNTNAEVEERGFGDASLVPGSCLPFLSTLLNC